MNFYDERELKKGMIMNQWQIKWDERGKQIENLKINVNLKSRGNDTWKRRNYLLRMAFKWNYLFLY